MSKFVYHDVATFLEDVVQVHRVKAAGSVVQCFITRWSGRHGGKGCGLAWKGRIGCRWGMMNA